MIQLIHLNRAPGINGETDSGAEITIGANHIVFIENCHTREPGKSKILLTNGKTIYVEEFQNQIRDLANEGATSEGQF
ncbi:MAG: hypothetical protein RLZZ165_2404 [Bacteroidota bacterium]|jgi:hypothetical protein